jgi:hypothetical protein
MPVVIPKPAPPPVAIKSEAPPAPPPAGVTIEQLETILRARDEVWANQLALLSHTFTEALKAMKPRGVAIKFKTNERGAIVGADLVPTQAPTVSALQ